MTGRQFKKLSLSIAIRATIIKRIMLATQLHWQRSDKNEWSPTHRPSHSYHLCLQLIVYQSYGARRQAVRWPSRCDSLRGEGLAWALHFSPSWHGKCLDTPTRRPRLITTDFTANQRNDRKCRFKLGFNETLLVRQFIGKANPRIADKAQGSPSPSPWRCSSPHSTQGLTLTKTEKNILHDLFSSV